MVTLAPPTSGIRRQLLPARRNLGHLLHMYSSRAVILLPLLLATVTPSSAPSQLPPKASSARQAYAASWLTLADDSVLSAAARRNLPDTGLIARRADARMTLAGMRSLGYWYQFPVSLTLSAATCGSPNAAYLPRASHIILCDELLTLVAPRQASPADFEEVAAAISAPLAHELGHALIDQLSLPRLGREEDAADQFAVWLLFDRLYSGDPHIAASGMVTLINALGKLSASETASPWVMTSTHGLTLVRIANLMCWTEGFLSPFRIQTGDDPAKRDLWDETARRLLSPERRAQCPSESAEIRKAWTALLRPWATPRR